MLFQLDVQGNFSIVIALGWVYKPLRLTKETVSFKIIIKLVSIEKSRDEL